MVNPLRWARPPTQTVMVLIGQKPIQRAQQGECSEDLPEATKSVGHVEKEVLRAGVNVPPMLTVRN